MKILVSACLLGINCKYDGGNNLNRKVVDLMENNELIPVCPECLGRLPVPRIPAEIVNGEVINARGESVDKQFRKGSTEALEIAMNQKVDYAILKSRSPSCGLKQVYDGTFSGKLREGSGIFATLLLQNGIKAIESDDLL